MFCPQCGSTQSDETKYCKSCGANLQVVRQSLAGEAAEKFDWSKTWVAEMFLSQEELKRRKEEIERQRGITPEVKRYNEIRAGVITSSVGVGVMIFLYVFMQGVIAGGEIPQHAAEIISRVWVAGVIPFFIGLGLMINGAFVSKRMVEALRQERAIDPAAMKEIAGQQTLRTGDETEFIPRPVSVTEATTRQLSDPAQKP
ncbi:MAG TPA: hypothetical protein VNO14_07755 [Blastocatellia bacterium]|nr:hypothetical protein [Blastocatellia bacterium]